MTITASYSPVLVGLSLLVATLASYTALDLAGRAPAAGGTARAFWVAATAVTGGGAIWSTHILGLLALLPPPPAYEPGTIAAALAAATAAAGLAAAASSRPTTLRRAAAAVMVGIGIVASHHLILTATDGLVPRLSTLAVGIAVAGSAAALWLTGRRHGLPGRIAGAALLAGAMAGSHYAAMVSPQAVAAVADLPSLPLRWLLVAVAALSLATLLLALVAAQADRRQAAREEERRLSDITAAFPGTIFRCERDRGGRIGASAAGGTLAWLFSGGDVQDGLPRGLDADGRDRWREALRRSAETGAPFSFEGMVETAPGAICWIRSQATAHRRRDGSVVWDGFVLDVTDERRADDAHRGVEEQLRSSLSEKEMLLAEIHHRVRNNLQVIISMMRLESGGIADPTALQRIETMSRRVLALGRIHDQLYRVGHLGRIEFDRYLDDLCASLSALLPDGVTIDLTAAPLGCPLDTAIPLGLIANELITDSLSHAFPDGRTGRITVALRRAGHNVVLTVSDDGERTGRPAPSGLGRRLVGILARQIDAALDDPGDGRVTLSIPGDRFTGTVAPPAGRTATFA